MNFVRKNTAEKKNALIEKEKNSLCLPTLVTFLPVCSGVFTCFCTKWPLASSFLRRCEKILKGEFDKIIGPSEKEGFESVKVWGSPNQRFLRSHDS